MDITLGYYFAAFCLGWAVGYGYHAAVSLIAAVNDS